MDMFSAFVCLSAIVSCIVASWFCGDLEICRLKIPCCMWGMCKCHVLCLLVAFLIWLPGVVCHGCIVPSPSCCLCLDIPSILVNTWLVKFSFSASSISCSGMFPCIQLLRVFSTQGLCGMCGVFHVSVHDAGIFLYVCVFASVYFPAVCRLAKVVRC